MRLGFTGREPSLDPCTAISFPFSIHRTVHLGPREDAEVQPVVVEAVAVGAAAVVAEDVAVENQR